MTLSNITAVLSALSFSERMTCGGQVFVVGMLTVFAALTILWMVLVLFRFFAYDIPQKKRKTGENVSTEKADEVSAENEAFPVDAEGDQELVAVITAAIEAYNSQSGSSLPFRVVSYKRLKGANGWNGNDTNETI